MIWLLLAVAFGLGAIAGMLVAAYWHGVALADLRRSRDRWRARALDIDAAQFRTRERQGEQAEYVPEPIPDEAYAVHKRSEKPRWTRSRDRHPSTWKDTS